MVETEQGVAIRYPEAFMAIGYQPGAALNSLKDKEWLVPVPNKPRALTHTLTGQHGSKDKYLILEPEISRNFLAMLKTTDTGEATRASIEKPQGQAEAGKAATTDQKVRIPAKDITNAIEAAYADGEVDASKVYIIRKGESDERLRLPYPQVVQAVAKRLNMKVVDITGAITRSPIALARGGRLVCRIKEDEFILIYSKFLPEIAAKNPPPPPTEAK